jgi:hypothetical protein
MRNRYRLTHSKPYLLDRFEMRSTQAWLAFDDLLRDNSSKAGARVSTSGRSAFLLKKGRLGSGTFRLAEIAEADADQPEPLLGAKADAFAQGQGDIG